MDANNVEEGKKILRAYFENIISEQSEIRKLDTRGLVVGTVVEVLIHLDTEDKSLWIEDFRF
jgi:hypothetical protein